MGNVPRPVFSPKASQSNITWVRRCLEVTKLEQVVSWAKLYAKCSFYSTFCSLARTVPGYGCATQVFRQPEVQKLFNAPAHHGNLHCYVTQCPAYCSS